jgi:hypothetical protein
MSASDPIRAAPPPAGGVRPDTAVRRLAAVASLAVSVAAAARPPSRSRRWPGRPPTHAGPVGAEAGSRPPLDSRLKRLGSGGGCDLASSAFRRPFDSRPHSAERNAAGGGVAGSRRDNASYGEPRSWDGSRSESRNARSATRTAAIRGALARPNRALAGNGRRPAWPDRPGANRAETRKLSRRRGQKRQTLGYNRDRFLHTLGLPN